MISITSVISFAIVLLAASSYAAPIDNQPDNSKLILEKPYQQPIVKQQEYNNAKDSATVYRKDRSSEEKDSDELTTEPVTRPPRGIDSKESDELTTEVFTRPPRGFDSKESEETTTEFVTRPPRGIDSKESDETTTEFVTRPPRGIDSKESEEMTTEVFTRPTRGFDQDMYPSTTEENNKRTVEDYLYTTLESSTNFNQRAIGPVESQEEIEASSPIPSDQKKKSLVEEQSSVQSFGKSTGLLQDKPIDRSSEEYGQNQRVKQPSSFVPQRIGASKVYSNSPSQKSVVFKPVGQEQLSQVQSQPNIKKTKPDY